MIARIWHGYTKHEHASVYEIMLREEIFTGIRARNMNGFIDIQLLKRKLDNEAV